MGRRIPIPLRLTFSFHRHAFPFLCTSYTYIAKKWSRLFSQDHSFISTITCPCFRLSASTRLRIASSAISFRLPSASISAAASSDSPLSSAFASNVSGPSIPRLSPLPFRFLTSAVSAFFRPLQFWILTTQPLLFLSFSSRFRLAAASPVPDSALASSVSPFSPA